MTSTRADRSYPELRTVGRFVDERVTNLQNRTLNPAFRDASATAALARLRRGVGKEPGELLDILEFTFSTDFVDSDDPESASPAERAAHLAMTLFAAHQQSRGERMHRRGVGLGTALRSLHSGDPKSLPDPLIRRFRMLGTADSLPELSHHLRGVVQLLRAGAIPLDYGLLADQLVAWQRFDRNTVQLNWGRQFYRTPKRDRSDSDSTEQPRS